ncbi:MAG TPA: DUF4149 domain-containing protein [Candidatus Acidoferrum sp.]|jgi:hypothetical protein
MNTVEFLCLGLWLGSDVFLSFVVAPGAFRVLASRDQAGAMVGFALTRMHIAGLFCGAIFLLARLARTRSIVSLGSPGAVCVVVMMMATLVSQFTVSVKMASLRTQMGSIQSTAADNPLLAEFSRLHRVSVSLESVVLLAGIAATFLLVRELHSAQ